MEFLAWDNFHKQGVDKMEDSDEILRNLVFSTKQDAIEKLNQIKNMLNRMELPFNDDFRTTIRSAFRKGMIRVNDHLRYEQVVPSVGIDIGGSDTMNDIVAEASREQDCLMEIEDGGLKSFSLFGNPSPSTSKHDKVMSAPESIYDDKRFYCFHCHTANKSTESFSVVADVHKHWTHSHSMEKPTKPFMFFVGEFFACHYCGTIATYSELLRHLKRNHPKESVAIVDKDNRMKCSLCEYVGEEIVDHFSTDHLILVRSNAFSPVRMTNDTIGELMAIDIHKKLECGYCSKAFESKNELVEHNSNDHLGQNLNSRRLFDNKLIHLLCGYCGKNVKPDKYFKHVENHTMYALVCQHCQFTTANLDILIKHDIDAHDSVDAIEDNLMILSNLVWRHCYYQTKVVFGNGLVLMKPNLIGTTLDDYAAFNIFVFEYVDQFRKSLSKTEDNGANPSNDNEDSDGQLSSSSDDDCVITEVTYGPDEELKKQNDIARNVSILGVPIELDAQFKQLLCLSFEKLNINLTNNDVECVNRPAGQQLEIIITFATRSAKNQFLAAAWKANVIKLGSGVSIGKLDIRHHLTDYYLDMWMTLATEKSEDNIHSFELTRMGIEVKRTSDGPIIYIRTKKELATLINAGWQ